VFKICVRSVCGLIEGYMRYFSLVADESHGNTHFGHPIYGPSSELGTS
jgi:hypothetical protein